MSLREKRRERYCRFCKHAFFERDDFFCTIKKLASGYDLWAYDNEINVCCEWYEKDN